jgi:methyl-accepting chemotaxis protein
MFSYIDEIPVNNTELANNILDAVNMTARQTAMLGFDSEGISAREEAIRLAAEAIVKNLEELKRKQQNPEMMALITEFEVKIGETREFRKVFMESILNNDIEAARLLRRTNYAIAINNSTEAAMALTEFATAETHNYAKIESKSQIAATTNLMIIVAIIIMVVLISFAVIIIKGITSPLKKAVAAANSIAEGNLKVDLQSDAKDETGLLMASLSDMVNTLSQAIGEVNYISKQCLNGVLKDRADANKYSGAYRELIAGVNSTVEALVDPLNVANKFLQDIATGNKDMQRCEKNYKGEFNDLKNSINTTHGVLFNFLGQFQRISDAADNGDLSVRADKKGTEGA